jgi:hypothetical protein
MSLALRHEKQEQITVSTSKQTITSALFDSASAGVPLNIVSANIQHIAGGDVYHTTNTTTPSNSGANGEYKMVLGDIWEVKSLRDIKNWSAIIASGESDATLQVELVGAP